MNQFTPKNINNNPNSVRGDLQVSGDLIVAENTLTAMNTGVYEINTTLQGTITLSSANEICTVLHIGDGVWTLLNFT